MTEVLAATNGPAWASPAILAAHPYAPILILILAIMGIVALIMTLTHLIGPKRHGPQKDLPYEAGMPTIGDARRHFHIRFYVVALLFLLFDVEVVFLWPWAVAFHHAAVGDGQPIVTAAGTFDSTFLLISMAVFVALLVVGFVYEWGKGMLKWS